MFAKKSQDYGCNKQKKRWGFDCAVTTYNLSFFYTSVHASIGKHIGYLWLVSKSLTASCSLERIWIVASPTFLEPVKIEHPSLHRVFLKSWRNSQFTLLEREYCNPSAFYSSNNVLRLRYTGWPTQPPSTVYGDSHRLWFKKIKKSGHDSAIKLFDFMCITYVINFINQMILASPDFFWCLLLAHPCLCLTKNVKNGSWREEKKGENCRKL